MKSVSCSDPATRTSGLIGLPSGAAIAGPRRLPSIVALTPPAASARSARPAPRQAGASYVLIDLSQQRSYEHHHGAATNVLHVSTGGGYRYRSADGVSRVATTPVGRFRIYRKAVGWQPSFPGAAAIPFFQRNPVGTPVIIVR